MARFDKLEFGAREQAAQTPRQPSDSQRDETHWLREADKCRRSGQYENALRYYSRALELNKSLVSGWLGQVQMLILLDEYQEAELWSRKSLELFPSHADLLAGRAQACCRIGDLKQAHVLCDGALQQNGQSAYGWQVRGELMVAGRQDIDRHCFDKAEQLDHDWLVPLETALMYLFYGVASKAALRARQAVEKASDQYYTWYVQALCLIQLGSNAQARASLKRCLELAPRHVEAQRELHKLTQAGWSPARFVRRLFGRG